MMTIQRSVDVEDVIRQALNPYVTAYCLPLPAVYAKPCVLIQKTGGTSADTIDTHTVELEVRAETEAEASETIRTAIGILEAQAKSQTTPLRGVQVVSLESWTEDIVRPDLVMCMATISAVTHRETIIMEV